MRILLIVEGVDDGDFSDGVVVIQIVGSHKFGIPELMVLVLIF
jgi:hypothetical protein